VKYRNLDSLNAYSSLLDASLDVLKQLHGAQSQSQNVADMKPLKSDYRAVVTLLDVNATKLALAMKPPVTWKAVEVLVKELEKHV
jgi:hypothetical protein